MVKDELLNLKVATFDINKNYILNVSMYLKKCKTLQILDLYNKFVCTYIIESCKILIKKLEYC